MTDQTGKNTCRNGMLAVDVDGTLITDHGHITDKVYRALETAAAADWEVVIASGRTWYAARRVCSELPFVSYALTSNGACIRELGTGEVIHMESLLPKTATRIIESMRAKGAIPAVYNTDLDNQRVYYDTLEDACELFTWYVTTDKRYEVATDVLDLTDDVLQIGTIARKDIITAISDDLADDDVRVMTMPFENERFGGKNHDYWFLQAVGPGALKVNAINRLYGMLDIPSGRLVTVGDNYNDADMITHADVGVAMGNAPDEIKALARVVVSTNNHSGLSEVVEQVLFSGKYFPEPDCQRGGGK
jgi:Cof subfamily protein (haloacid dehalogenase superfamily)